MGKKERTLFYGEIEIPENVQKKADLAFLQIKNSQNERAKNMENQEIRDIQSVPEQGKRRKRMKPFAAVAACAVLVAAAGIGQSAWAGRETADQTKTSRTETGQTETASVENGDTGHVSTISRPFVLSVKEAETGENVELTKGTPVSIGANPQAWVLGGAEDNICSYCINLPFVCEGENIDTITYSINKGAFQIVEKEGGSIIVSGKKADEPVSSGQIGGGYDEATGEYFPADVKYYTEYTLDYDCQTSDETWVNMVRDNIVLSDKDLIWGENCTDEDVKKGYQELVGGVIITCTVNFSDGTKETAELEAGVAIGDAAKGEREYKDVLFTFERK